MRTSFLLLVIAFSPFSAAPAHAEYAQCPDGTWLEAYYRPTQPNISADQAALCVNDNGDQVAVDGGCS